MKERFFFTHISKGKLYGASLFLLISEGMIIAAFTIWRFLPNIFDGIGIAIETKFCFHSHKIIITSNIDKRVKFVVLITISNELDIVQIMMKNTTKYLSYI